MVFFAFLLKLLFSPQKLVRQGHAHVLFLLRYRHGRVPDTVTFVSGLAIRGHHAKQQASSWVVVAVVTYCVTVCLHEWLQKAIPPGKQKKNTHASIHIFMAVHSFAPRSRCGLCSRTLDPPSMGMAWCTVLERALTLIWMQDLRCDIVQKYSSSVGVEVDVVGCLSGTACCLWLLMGVADRESCSLWWWSGCPTADANRLRKGSCENRCGNWNKSRVEFQWKIEKKVFDKNSSLRITLHVQLLLVQTDTDCQKEDA